MPGRNLQKSSQSRVYTIENRAGPANPPRYQMLARALALAWTQGDITPVRIPDPNQYGRFLTVDSIKAQAGLPTISIENRLSRDLSDFLRLIRNGCSLDMQLHIGICTDPRDFNGGWEKILVFEGASPSAYNTGDLGALDGDQNVPVLETIPLTGLEAYELVRLAGVEIAAAELVQKIVGVVICDAKSCGECGIPSDGCQRFFAVTVSAGGSPGLPAEIIFSQNGGGTIQQTTVTTLIVTEDPSGLACVGSNLVVISQGGLAIHYAPIANILLANETWTKTVVGLVAAKGPNAIFSLGRTLTWLVGQGGYVYFSSDITGGVVVQSAGSASVQNLNAIHGVDELNLVAVGASNAVLVTTDGGETWISILGPAVGVALNTVFMKSENEWFIGTAGGQLWYTRNAGSTWTQKAFPGSGAGVVRDIKFSTSSVGYLAHDTATPTGRVLRTIDGGYSWYVLPEMAGQSLPDNDQISALAACAEDPNLVYAGGLGANATDGILVRVSG